MFYSFYSLACWSCIARLQWNYNWRVCLYVLLTLRILPVLKIFLLGLSTKSPRKWFFMSFKKSPLRTSHICVSKALGQVFPWIVLVHLLSIWLLINWVFPKCRFKFQRNQWFFSQKSCFIAGAYIINFKTKLMKSFWHWRLNLCIGSILKWVIKVLNCSYFSTGKFVRVGLFQRACIWSIFALF